MERPFPSYAGDGPYIFVSYAHDDADVVYPGITWLRDQGFNIWYDEGISPGASWREELAQAILKCDLFVILVSPRSARSNNCLKEVNFALEHDREILAIHQEPTELSPGLQLALSDRQAIFRHELTDQQYRDKILAGVRSHIQPSQGPVGPAPLPPITRTTSNRGLAVAVGAVAVIVAIVIGFQLVELAPSQPGETVGAPTAAPSTERQTVRSQWIAVLPFNVLSGDKDIEALAAALTPQMIRSLQPIDNFSIVNYRAVEKYRNRSIDIGEIARELNVRYLIDGNIQHAGDRTRVGIELVDGIRGISLWQDTRTFTGNDYLAMQDEVSLLTTRILSSRLQPIEMERLSIVPRDELSADELYMLSSIFWMDPNQENLDSGVRDLRRALEMEPRHAASMSVLAHFLTQQIQMGGAADPAATRTEVCSLANRAISLARDDQSINVVVYPLSDLCGEAEKAVQIMERLIELNPESASMWSNLSYAFLSTGQRQAALEALDKARSLDPDGLWVWYLDGAFRAIAFANDENWVQAIEAGTKAINENPGLYWLRPIVANAYGMTGDFASARAQWNLVIELFPNASVDRLSWMGPRYYDEGLRRAGIR